MINKEKPLFNEAVEMVKLNESVSACITSLMEEGDTVQRWTDLLNTVEELNEYVTGLGHNFQ